MITNKLFIKRKAIISMKSKKERLILKLFVCCRVEGKELEHILYSKVIFNFVNAKFVNDGNLQLIKNSKDSVYNTNIRFIASTNFKDIKEFICAFWVKIFKNFMNIENITKIYIYLEIAKENKRI